MNKTKTTQWLLSFVLLLTATLFTACSNSDSNSAIDEENQPAGPQGSLVSFGITTNKYSEVSRAAQENEGRVVSSSTENLGNGLEALVEVVETPTKTANTRAVGQAPAGDYTILAYQGTELKQKWEINYKSNGTYTMKDGSNPEKYLAPGSYKFYAFKNQDFELENGNYVAKLKNGENEPYLYEGNVTINNQLKTKLTFTLKPYFAKVKFKIKAFSKEVFDKPTNGHFIYDANTIPSSMILNAANGTMTSTNNNAAGQTNDFVSFTANEADGDNSKIESNNAMFFLPGTDITKLKFQFLSGISGTIYNKPIAGKSLKISNPITGGLKSGYEYIVSTTVYYTATYLFSDGTEGTMGNKGNRTPIAVYVGTVNGKKYAISLKDAANGVNWANNKYGDNTTPKGVNETINRYDGYKITHDWATTTRPAYDSNPVKATNQNFPAFYNAANYNAGVALTGTIANTKWFLPGLGEWNLAVENLLEAGSLKNKGVHNYINYNSGSLGYKKLDIIFRQAGGFPPDQYYWTADKYNNGNIYTVVIRGWANKIQLSFTQPTKSDGACRAFIQY
ncbi:hypothetical protein [Prevotella pallens]|uniref:hypothetical protein n=1 Tax=Prevotella pallens TaxID=60133 RepID=UPI0023F7E719|nr:hypothetical protein [Prevotella pallens]